MDGISNAIESHAMSPNTFPLAKQCLYFTFSWITCKIFGGIYMEQSEQAYCFFQNEKWCNHERHPSCQLLQSDASMVSTKMVISIVISLFENDWRWWIRLRFNKNWTYLKSRVWITIICHIWMIRPNFSLLFWRFSMRRSTEIGFKMKENQQRIKKLRSMGIVNQNELMLLMSILCILNVLAYA